MKVNKNKLSSVQKIWKEKLEIAGYKYDIFYQAEEAIKGIKQYLEMK